jgi:hypothetical protein
MYFQFEYVKICNCLKFGQNEEAINMVLENRDSVKIKHIKTFLDIAINTLNEEFLRFLVDNKFFETGINLKNCSLKYDKYEYYDKIDVLKKMLNYQKNNI